MRTFVRNLYKKSLRNADPLASSNSNQTLTRFIFSQSGTQSLVTLLVDFPQNWFMPKQNRLYTNLYSAFFVDPLRRLANFQANFQISKV